MARCDVCGNDYDKTFTVEGATGSGTFDSFECAIHALAPTCGHCGTRIIGHGVESNGQIYCCAHCAREEGERGLADRTEGAGGEGPEGVAPTRPPADS